MKAVVLLKQVPDTYGERKLDLETGLAVRTASEPVLDEISERALEVALRLSDAQPDTEVVVLTMGPASAVDAVRKGLSMGASSAVHILDDRLLGADLTTTADALAAALARINPDLVVAGNTSTDGSGGVLPSMLAEHLGVVGITNLDSVEIDGTALTGRRSSDGAAVSVRADLPAVISITEQSPDPRFPNFKGIMAAKKKPLEIWTLADLGIEVDDPSRSRSIITAISRRPPRESGVKIVDDGSGARQLADFLAAQRLI